MVAIRLPEVTGEGEGCVAWGVINTVILGGAHPIGEYIGRERMASYPSGQRDLTVNQLALPSGVRIPHSPQYCLSPLMGRQALLREVTALDRD